MARRRRLARDSGGGTRRPPLSPVSAAFFAVLLGLLVLACGCCCLAATKPAARTASVDAGGVRMNVKYSPEEVSRWMERMTNSPDSPFRPATDQENAFFNRMASGGASSSSSSNGGGYRQKTTTAKSGGGGGSGSSGGGGATGAGVVGPGFDGHIEFSDHYPFARIVVDGFHSAGESSSSSPSQPDGEAAESPASSHAEYYDVKDL